MHRKVARIASEWTKEANLKLDFGADPARSNAFPAPACLADERTDDCLARIADIGQERQRVDQTLSRLQGSLAAHGIVAPHRYMALAKYLVATSCWEGL